jgi:hypothetical protein
VHPRHIETRSSSLRGAVMEEGEEGEAVGVVFDCDGTLADSLPPHIAFLHAMNVELGAGLTLPAERDRRGCRELAAAPMDNFLRSAGFTEADVARCVQRYEASFAEEHPVFLFDGVPALLRRLSEGGAKLAIVSSNTSRNVRACLKNGVGSGAVRGGGGDAAQQLPKFDFMCASALPLLPPAGACLPAAWSAACLPTCWLPMLLSAHAHHLAGSLRACHCKLHA